MNGYENYYHRPMFNRDICPWEHECGCEYERPRPCPPPPCSPDPFGCEDCENLYTRHQCPCESTQACCKPSFTSYLCEFINKKVIITMGCRRIRCVILEVSCSTVKCLCLGNGKIIFINAALIDNVRPLSY